MRLVLLLAAQPEELLGVREGSAGKLYLAYLRDLDGHKLCAHTLNGLGLSHIEPKARVWYSYREFVLEGFIQCNPRDSNLE